MGTAALVLAAVVLLLTGCAGESTPSTRGSASAPADPFVGTWRISSGDHPRFVISQQDGRYTVVQGIPGENHYLQIASFKRSDNRLTGTVSAPNEGPMTLTTGAVPERMALTFDGPDMSEPFRTTLTKLTDSTVTPTPVP